jgi:hypothetical protein
MGYTIRHSVGEIMVSQNTAHHTTTSPKGLSLKILLINNEIIIPDYKSSYFNPYN